MRGQDENTEFPDIFRNHVRFPSFRFYPFPKNENSDILE